LANQNKPRGNNPCTNKLSNRRLSRHHLHLQNRNPNFPQTLAATMTTSRGSRHFHRQPSPHLRAWFETTHLAATIASHLLRKETMAAAKTFVHLHLAQQPSSSSTRIYHGTCTIFAFFTHHH